ncbi:uncharacterized protein LOC110115327 isoform X2 [Dendrobium catenatum]|uniref:uncharacterized protein LOC110115327 isoform X2 n=1 Tax=Dendrobium catenatum TaxID=906689 RepID=UPI0009F63EFF|nr:uncharacterized protein LOC110115327 isoform X2 [Dendrobium catenatum]
MFDILIGRKFSNKCKRSVKYIKCRIETIRKKKQVMVRYLKQDVADLLARSHDANAFGRIDALIVEINHASCYDMIEQYCGCLLENISTMRKHRECPKEAMEAVATLLFATARFSDLPELADLRSVFTKRYGTLMESCIDKQFAEKIQKKSFSNTRKLQLMEDIAQEFSVNWNSNMFENKMSNHSAPSHDNPIKHQLVNKENEKQFPERSPQKHQIQPKEQIDFQTTPTEFNIHAHDRTEKTVKMTTDVLEDAKSEHPDIKTNFKTKYKNESIFDGNARGRFQRVHEGINLVATERQSSTDAVNRDFKAINTIPPPYTKLPEWSNGSIAVHDNFPSSEDKWPHRPLNASGRRTFNSQPPYRKPNVSKSPNGANYANPADYEKSTEDQGNDHSEAYYDQQGREITRTNGLHGEAYYDQQKFIIKQASSNRQRHGSRRTVQATKDGRRDEEEEVVDKLLMHYSKKGTNNEPRMTRRTMRGALKGPLANPARVPENLDEGKLHHNTLLQEQTCPA